jgi:hypothetical protein
VVEAASSSYDLRPTYPMARDARVLRMASTGPFHIPSFPRVTQSGFSFAVVGPSVNEGCWRRFGHVSTTIREKKTGSPVWTSMGGHSIACARWAYSAPPREN